MPILFVAASAAASDARTGGPYVPTPQAVVDEMLDLAGVGPQDFVIDLGSGDGRIVLTAASRFRARGLGIDIDPELVALSNREARRRSVDGLVRFELADALKARIDQATVLTLYLLPELMQPLRDRIYRQLRPGARVVSHDFSFREWDPDRSITVDVAEKYGTAGGWKSTLYLWIVPAKVEGRWQAAVAGDDGTSLEVSFVQKFQRIEGHAIVEGGERIALKAARLDGAAIRFVVPETKEDPAREFSATVEGDTMHGTVAFGGDALPWHARRLKRPLSLRPSR